MYEIGASDALLSGGREILDAHAKAKPNGSSGSGGSWWMVVVFLAQIFAALFGAVAALVIHPIEMALRLNDITYATSGIPGIVATAAMSYPGGILTDVFQRRHLVAVGAVLTAVSYFITAGANSWDMLAFAGVVAGIGNGLWGPAVFSMLTDAFPRSSRAYAMSLYTACAAALGATILPLNEFLAEVTHQRGTVHLAGVALIPWQQCYALSAILNVVTAVLVYCVAEPVRRQRMEQTRSDFKRSLGIFGGYILRHGLLWSLILVASSAAALSPIALVTWGAAFGQRNYDATGVSAIALLGFLGSGGSFFGSILGGVLAQRSISSANTSMLPRMLTVVAIFSCIFALTFPYMPSWILALVGIAGLNATSAASGILQSIAIQETVPNEARGQLVGFAGLIGNVPWAVAGTLVAYLASGVFAKVGGLAPSLAVTGGFSLLAVVLFHFCTGPYQKAVLEMRGLATTDGNA